MVPPDKHKIEFPEAVDLIFNFISDSNLSLVAHNCAIGGTLNRIPSINGIMSLLTLLSQQFDGNLAWLCWNQTDIKHPPFFLAFEQVIGFDPDKTPDVPIAGTLMRGGNYFPYSADNTRAAVEHFISTHNIGLVPADVLITNAEVTSFVDNFNNKFPKFLSTTSYQKKPLGFYENGISKDVTEFLEQGGANYVKGVRYYFGYRQDAFPYTLRIILVAVDKDGNNIIFKPGSTSEFAIMLERNWPPV